ncbi:MAG: hypothetical protein J6C53_00415 [Clostridia bacterium]|nr:hypothetical protein [Clostridia bacterium]
MNKTKKYLIITAIIFSFVDIGWQIYNIVQYFLTAPQHRSPVFYVILDFLTIATSLAVAVLLILAIWKNGTLFRYRYGYYMTALMLSIVINLFSVTSILLIITMFISDWVWEKPKEEKEEKVVEVKQSREEKIANLRLQLEKGEITQEEFDQKLLEIL